ncbi:MAG: hypothetical protein FD145_181 [Candidatus Saganbacteria bacterium]|uniref:Transcriptional regulator, AbiEi antitoxin, Type IV TA system n=1 Tax=Candidatus Saganbacteria bacterium TaxID=2575572 RepID=A0A833L249_UNCSA|nr:MAG: hypothetical protein FD145_181 [Candidatus Saganbacteria bacterium]
MKWKEFVEIAGNLPVIDTEMLLAGVANPNSIKVQISRWKKQGKVIQIKRGIYALAEPYKKLDVYEPYLAALLKQPSYISLEKAFEYHGLIPEGVSVYTCITTKRPGKIISKLGVFDYKHVKASLFWGYTAITVNKQTAFMALPEKALLDFFYLKGIKISPDYLNEMRLQNLRDIDLDQLLAFAKKFKKPGMLNVAKVIREYVGQEKDKDKEL